MSILIAYVRLSGVGVGTSRSMHTGHATSEWLQGVVSNEVNDLAAAVDNHARQRELKISTAERAQLNLQISNVSQGRQVRCCGAVK